MGAPARSPRKARDANSHGDPENRDLARDRDDRSRGARDEGADAALFEAGRATLFARRRQPRLQSHTRPWSPVARRPSSSGSRQAIAADRELVTLCPSISSIMCGPCCRRLGREYDVSPVLIGEVAVYDHINATAEMASRFQTASVPRWRYGEPYLALLDTLEAALPLGRPSDLFQELHARRIFAMSEGLIGETVRLVAEAAVLAVGGGDERITRRTLDALDHVPLSGRRQAPLRQHLL